MTVTAAPARARTATLVVVGPSPRLVEAASVLADADEAGALHTVLVSTGAHAAVEIADRPEVVTIGGLKPEYVDNAIAGVRLSSLPTVIWWRGGEPEGLDRVASLADRVILDVDDPYPLWSRAAALFDDTALTDLRWARLTRWRGAMAHFFDLPGVREIAPGLASVTIVGSDEPQCALFAGWLDSSLGWKGRIRPAIKSSPSGMPMQEVEVSSPAARLVLRLMPNTTCLDTHAQAADTVLASRVISLGDQSLAALLSDELRVRSRDLAFERALVRTIEAATS